MSEREFHSAETLHVGSENPTRDLVADLRTALRSLRRTIQAAASKPEDARDALQSSQSVDAKEPPGPL